MFFRIARLHRQRLFPILPILICQHHGDGRADRLAVMHSRQKMRAVSFNLHAAAASKSLLATPQFPIHKCLVHRQSGGQPGKKGNQRLAMGLSGSKVAQHVEKAL